MTFENSPSAMKRKSSVNAAIGFSSAFYNFFCSGCGMIILEQRSSDEIKHLNSFLFCFIFQEAQHTLACAGRFVGGISDELSRS